MSMLTAVCEGCRFPAEPRRSVVWIDLAAVGHAMHTPHMDLHPFEDPTIAHWRIHHIRCLPDDRGPYYDLDMDQLDTADGLASWTKHLAGKRWVPHTDWHALVATTVELGQITTSVNAGAA